MNGGEKEAAEGPEEREGLAALALLSLLVGAVSGLVGAIFRLCLDQADRGREALITWAHGPALGGFFLVASLCAAAAAAAAWMVRRFAPYASGSGIPHVEAVLNGNLPQAPYRLIPVKFVGGILAIGAGLALGREGPSVQMGATIAHFLGRVFRRNLLESLMLFAAGAGAGLATAFNAPIAGAVFVLEELLRRFDTRVAITTFGASTGAIAVGRLLLGEAPDFHVASLPYAGFGAVPLYLVLGVLSGLLGIAYNRTLLATLTAADRLGRWPVEWRAAGIGAAVGMLAWFAPGVVGGGDAITQETLARPQPLLALTLALLVRFGLGAMSYAALTPGGLFAPLLVLGAQSGMILGLVFANTIPNMVPDPTALAVVGMAAFFTAVVRAPLTGIVLVIEMTGCFTLLLPMLGACFTAMLVPTLLGNAPIYDSLRERTLRSEALANSIPGSRGKITNPNRRNNGP